MSQGHDPPQTSGMPDDLAEKMRGAGWRQGSILPRQAILDGQVLNLGEVDWASDDLVMVITQDCDLVTSNDDEQPDVELIILRSINEAKVDSSKLHRKHPRLLHISIGGRHYEAWARRRYWIPRAALAEYVPEDHFPVEKIREVAHWLIDAYIRPAFPDEFNRRAAAQRSSIRNKLKGRAARSLSGLYLVVNPDEELEEGAEYEVILVATMTSASYPESQVRISVQGLVDGIAAKLNACPGIVVVEDHLKPESEISLDDLRYLRRWDTADLSYRDKPIGESAPRA